MSSKVILCRCEDVTLADVRHAVASGFADLEEVKRYTGFGTGPCQGKECLRAVALAIAEASQQPPSTIHPFTTRPPLVPTELKLFTPLPSDPLPSDPLPSDPLAPHSEERARERGPTTTTTTTTTSSPLPPHAQIAIIGAGIMGLGIAHNLALLGQRGIVVLDAHTLAWGASGRNGGGLRQQWSTELNIRLMQESIEICRSFAQQMGINIWMRQGGYLFLAQREETLARLERNVALQNRCDVPTRQISVDEVRTIVPEIDVAPFVGACYNPTDGIVFPWPFLWGYARAAAKRGVVIATQTPVTAVERRGDDFVLTTPRGTMTAGRVINATGAWSPALARMVGGTLPDWPARHEILSTEPLKPFLKPMVSVLESGLYFSQSLRGEVVGGISLDDPRADDIQMGSRLSFVQKLSRGMLQTMPLLGDVKVVRQWAGPYDISPDGNPLVGELPGVPGFFVCCGFMGHGFMMAPVVSRHYARWLTGGERHALFDAWNVARFQPGGSTPGTAAREDMIIG